GNFEYYNLANDVEIGIPSAFNLSQNYPNPFNPATKIDFSLPVESKVSLIIYDVTGREAVRLINNEIRKADYYTVAFNGSSLSSGVYFYKIISDNFVQTKKMMFIK
ncbi:MAG: T9SS type A sorting domain-containing protein, partial [Ignavibacteriota bacterium]